MSSDYEFYMIEPDEVLPTRPDSGWINMIAWKDELNRDYEKNNYRYFDFSWKYWPEWVEIMDFLADRINEPIIDSIIKNTPILENCKPLHRYMDVERVTKMAEAVRKITKEDYIDASKEYHLDEYNEESMEEFYNFPFSPLMEFFIRAADKGMEIIFENPPDWEIGEHGDIDENYLFQSRSISGK